MPDDWFGRCLKGDFMFSDLGHDPIECILRDAVKRGYTITIGPHKDAPCGIMATKDGQTFAKGCEVDAKQIDRALQHMPSIWKAQEEVGANE